MAEKSTKKNDEDVANCKNNYIETVMEAVQALPDMDEDLLLYAFDFLAENNNQSMAKVFISMDVKLRKKWLIRKLRPQPQMKIFVKTMDGKKMSLDVLTTDTILDVKAKIKAKEGYPPDDERLVFNGWKLEDEATLGDCGVWSGSSLHMILCVCHS